MASVQTLYKLIILYMLEWVEFPLSNTQIADLVLEKEYTTYFVLQNSFQELLDDGYITATRTHNNMLYRITKEGKETLLFFSDKISDGIKADIKNYFKENEIKMKEEVSRFADYYKTTNNQYAARCLMKDNFTGSTRLELNMTVPTRAMAAAICENWTKTEQDVYGYLLDLLVQ